MSPSARAGSTPKRVEEVVCFFFAFFVYGFCFCTFFSFEDRFAGELSASVFNLHRNMEMIVFVFCFVNIDIDIDEMNAG